MAREYADKRDFSRTPEPAPGLTGADAGPLAFVIQKHAARRLHYDFRLELDGVLKSWSVPGGPSLDPKVKRLAVMVEDHPVDYRSFEGVIPAGEYGAGQVIVWDHGSYSPEDEGRLAFGDRARAQQVARDGLARGKLSLTLRGHKLKGSWALVKMQKTANDWLLIKHRDAAASASDILREERSVISRLSIDDLKAGRVPGGAPPPETRLAGLPGARRSPMPSGVAPMLAGLAGPRAFDERWLFEPKLDGFRTIALVRDGAVRLLSRNGIDVTAQYPFLIEGLSRQPASELVLDGEVIALDEKGRLCFQCLQQLAEAMRPGTRAAPPVPVIYYVFDILFLDGFDLSDIALVHRKEWLDAVLWPTDRIRPVDYFEGDSAVVYEAAVNAGLEGIVAKARDGRYEAGRRSSSWLKLKNTLSDDFVVGGFTRGTGNRARTFGALLLGQYDEKGGLVFNGHVGSGFDEPALADLRRRLEGLKSDRCPFAQPPPENAPVTWVRPGLVVEVKFGQWTQEGYLRTPVFLRVRDDKSPAEVRRAEAVTPTTGTPVSDRVIPAAAKGNEALLQQLRQPAESLTLQVEGHEITLSNLNKELWPATVSQHRLTKRDFIGYLVQASSYLLPHLRDRPLTLTRFPDGIHGEHFYQKHWPGPIPEFVETVPLREHKGTLQDYLLCNNLATLVWLGQLADIELHTWFSRISPGPDGHDLVAPGRSRTEMANRLSAYPDFIVFDIDPYIYSGAEPAGAEPELNRAAFAQTCEAARWLKKVLDTLALASFVKTSGKTGLHVYVPVLRQLDYLATRSVAQTISRFVLQQHPQEITVDWAVEKRRGKVFLDFNQNVHGKTLASVYSPRPTPGATVSTPLGWDDLGKVYPTDFTMLNVPERLAATGDLWANILDTKQDVKALLK